MGANFSGGGATVFHDRTDTPGEITRELVNSTDGQGLHFADGGYVDGLNSAGAEFGTSDFSIEFILNQTEDNSADSYIYFTHIASPNRFYLFNDISSNVVQLGWQNSAGSTQLRNISYDMSADYNAPTHYALTCDRDGLATLYKNGNSVGSVDISAESEIDLGALNSTVSRFGSTSTYGVIGTFYRFRTWNKLLSQAEVTATYENATVPTIDRYGKEVYTSDFSSGVDGWSDSRGTGSGNNDSISDGTTSKNDCYKFYANAVGDVHAFYKTASTLLAGTVTVKLEYLIPGASFPGTGGGNTKVDGFKFYNNTTTSVLQAASVVDTWTTIEFTGACGAGDQFQVRLLDGASESFVGANDANDDRIFFKNIEINNRGCVVDYDLAFAQPEISTIVQNRNNTVSMDGTASAGVTQVTPIEQLNSKSARIGTSAATPADGDLLVSGAVGIGVTPATSQYLQVKVASNVNLSVSHNLGAVRLNAINDISEANVPMELTASSYQLIGGNVGIGVVPIGKMSIKGTTATAEGSHLTFENTAGAKVFAVGGGKSGVSNNGFSVVNVTDNTAPLTISDAGLTTVTNPGWPLKNELTNSGFDVWSNSTLENFATVDADTMASDDTGDWTDSASATLAFDTDHYELATSATNQSIETTFSALTTGKLYEFSLDVKDGTASSQPLYFHWYYSGSANGNSPTFTTTSSFVTHTWVFEATGAAAAAYIKVSNDMSGGNVELKNFSLKEVTPGCVAGSGNLSFDGTRRTANAVKLWRQHNDDGALTQDGSFYSLKMVTSTATTGFTWPASGGVTTGADPVHLQKFAGRTVTMGAWVKTDQASNAKIRMTKDAYSTNTVSTFHTGDNTWQWLEATMDCSASPTNVQFGIQMDGAGDGTATSNNLTYVSSCMLVFGNAIGSGNYSRPSGEVVNLETLIRLQENVSPAASDDKTLNLEALSGGKIPKGAKAVTLDSFIINSSVTGGHGILWQGGDGSVWSGQRNYPTVNNLASVGSGIVPCDANGDIYQVVTEADATLSGLYLDVTRIELR